MLGKVVSCLLHGHQLCQDLPPRQGTSAAAGSHLGWDSALRLTVFQSVETHLPFLVRLPTSLAAKKLGEAPPLLSG